ncbi:MAG: hypothetical protein M0C28_24170 [Candidatus Moduliflexus flocculans]|nr:hypothetical protein [Candidatus Moduliflexus flocculans]
MSTTAFDDQPRDHAPHGQRASASTRSCSTRRSPELHGQGRVLRRRRRRASGHLLGGESDTGDLLPKINLGYRGNHFNLTAYLLTDTESLFKYNLIG